MNITDIANDIVDTTQAIAENPLIGLIGLVFPQANSIIDVIRRNKAVIDAAQPIISEAVEAGIPVVEKVIEQLPKFGTVVGKIAALMPAAGDPGVALENIARVIGGIRPMTFGQELAWMNRMTPGNDPSQENSKYPVG